MIKAGTFVSAFLSYLSDWSFYSASSIAPVNLSCPPAFNSIFSACFFSVHTYFFRLLQQAGCGTPAIRPGKFLIGFITHG